MGSNYFTITPELVVAPVEGTAEDGNYGSFQVAGDSEQKVFTFYVLVDEIRLFGYVKLKLDLKELEFV